MTGTIVLDSGPLGLLAQRRDLALADDCRKWIAVHLNAGVRVVVPEVADYEVRRELLRLGNATAVQRLDDFNVAKHDRYLPLTTAAMRLAADLWAQSRRRGMPTADPHALDGDVILAAQVLSTGLDPADFVVATSNVRHLSQFVPADLWQNI